MTDLPDDPTVGTSLTLHDKYSIERTWSTTKYKDEFPELLQAHLEKGLSFFSFNVPGGVTTATLTNWTKRHPAFAHAREVGEKARLQLLEEEGIKMVKGGNVVAWKFMMNQHGIHEKVEHSHNHSLSPHMQVAPTIRYARLQKLKELHQRVTIEEQQKTILVEKEDEVYDALLDD